MCMCVRVCMYVLFVFLCVVVCVYILWQVVEERLEVLEKLWAIDTGTGILQMNTQTHTHTRIHAHTHTHARTHTRTHTHISVVDRGTQTHRPHTHTHTHTHMSVVDRGTHTHTHTYTHTHAHTHTFQTYGMVGALLRTVLERGFGVPADQELITSESSWAPGVFAFSIACSSVKMAAVPSCT